MTSAAAGTKSRTPAEQFAGVAASELSTLRELINVLNEERDALTRGDAEALPGMIATKTRHMAELSLCSTERGRVLSAAGIPASGSDIRGFLGNIPDALGTWEDLLSAARKAAGLNTANAFLTSTRLASVSRALAALTGTQPDFYDPRGINARSTSASRPRSQG